MKDQSLCSRCKVHPPVPGQRWCRPCKTTAERGRRQGLSGVAAPGGWGENAPVEERAPVPPAADGTAERPGGTPSAGAISPGATSAVTAVHQPASGRSRGVPYRGVGSEPPAPYVPYRGREIARAPWVDLYLLDLAKNGGHELAAAAAGVHRSVVQALRARDRDFADETEAALEYYRDRTEWESLELGRVRGNPLPYFARLKAERPARYVEKQIIASVDMTPDGFTNPGELRALLVEVLATATDATREQLGLPAVIDVECSRVLPPPNEATPA
jgi:hypothetical protein